MLTTQAIDFKEEGAGPARGADLVSEGDSIDAGIRLVEDIAGRYGIASLEPLIGSCRAFASEQTLNVAVLGRFKAGKSSFLNRLLGRDLLPIGVIPVTSVVSEIRYGPKERAEVRFLDGRTEEVPVEDIGAFVDEARNPENRKRVAMVTVELPTLDRFRGVRFVDTPGLESVLSHNTDASLEWLPNVGLAIVAVGVDPPLSKRDVELIRRLNRYTPNISLLLTKVDVLQEHERRQVEEFVRAQLKRHWSESIPVYPYSIRPGYETLRQRFEEALVSLAVERSGEQRRAILARKVETLVRECAEYLAVALKSAEAADSERESLKRKILGEKKSLDDSKLSLNLIVRHATTNSREQFARTLDPHEREITARLLEEFENEYPAWTRSLALAARRFEGWLEPAITEEMARLSAVHRQDFLEPLHRVGRQLSQSLQDFRNRISERTMEALGVPLRTTEVEIEAREPRSPDVRIGRIFDRQWELISFLIPMSIAKGVVRRHFRETVAGTVFKNLSRLASQWERSVNPALDGMGKEATRRLDDLVGTIERLVVAAGKEAPQIRDDLHRIESARLSLGSGGVAVQ
jgi:GTP-binding protein EngB required for normal cell division